MKLRVYIETSVVSYLTARPSTDALMAACQSLTKAWWASRLPNVDAYVSPYVRAEIARGDPTAAGERLEKISRLPILPVSDEIVTPAEFLVTGGGLPAKAQVDALHIASAAVHEIDVLLTWNCTHIANPVQLPVIRGLCSARGFRMPELVTPFEMMEMLE